jgi:hypothetical protein
MMQFAQVFLLHGQNILFQPFLKLGGNSKPNNYRTIMIGYTIAKLYVMVLNMLFSKHLERSKFRAKSQVGFGRDYQTIDHIDETTNSPYDPYSPYD